MVKIRGSKRLAQKSQGHEKVASDSPAEEKHPPQADHVVDEDDVLDPDPIRWALPADGEPVYRRGAAFNEVQLVHMYHLGHMVGWSLEKYHNDRTILTQICEKIGISRDQFRGFVFRKKFKIAACSSDTGSGRSGGNLNDEGGSSTSD